MGRCLRFELDPSKQIVALNIADTFSTYFCTKFWGHLILFLTLVYLMVIDNIYSTCVTYYDNESIVLVLLAQLEEW
jgi:hypothetical protein